MKCANCVLWYTDEGEDWPCCHADPNWPAPCEYNGEEDDTDYDYDL